ncbi:NAD(P)H-binding protein [Streptomyces sp. LHD-70]|uniref:SDR family oxidoreductase n=1 Tax=Streptomyces sp. LHD-70 TaxID=3072140 RepID=UPI00280F39B0|nr:NAD(P)H-binding protein [Streptomyces sp. LHD-70]MDQ8703347.1 NAD(P)H-binding protein [Streptomyces sp. LHD-70]
MTTILVTGGTGTLGRFVTERLRASGGHEVRELSRRSEQYPVDLRTGAGLADAVAGAEVIVHCASTQKSGADVEAARHLIDAARTAGVRHLVYISIVGIDRVPLGYYRTKLQVERLIEESGLGFTILRTTQFHDLALTFARGLTKLPVALAPTGVRLQPVAVDEVAGRLVELALGDPAGHVPEMGGPEVLSLEALVRAYLRASGKRRPVLGVRVPGRLFGALRAGGLLTPEHAVGEGTFGEFVGRTAR